MSKKVLMSAEGTYEHWVSSLEKKRKLVSDGELFDDKDDKRKCHSGYGVLLILNVKNGNVCAEVESIANNPNEDVWNAQPFLGKRTISARQVRVRNHKVKVANTTFN